MPGFNLIENESGAQRQEAPWSHGTRPESRPPAWLYKLLTMPVPRLSTAFDPQTGRRIVPYAPLINAGGTYPTTAENEHMTGSTLAYVDETSAPPDLSSVSAPSAEEWPSTDAEEWPSPDAEEWPSSDTEERQSSDAIKWPSDTEVQSQAPSTAPAWAPRPQQPVQQATWEAQLPRPTNSQLYSEGGGNTKFEDPRSAPMARLPSGIAAPSVRPIADNNFILANARDDAMRQHASANGGSYFGQGSVYRIGLNNARPRRDVPASNGIRNSVIASFGSLPRPRTPRINLMALILRTRRHLGIEVSPSTQTATAVTLAATRLYTSQICLGPTLRGPQAAALIVRRISRTTHSGAQYAQVIQQNNAILRNPRIDRTTERLLSILTETVESLGAGSGPIFGIQAHFEFAKRVKALNIPGIREKGVEQSFDLGRIVRYGLDGSVRTDIVLRDRSGIPIAIYDLKTGNAKLTPSRVQELRNAVGRQDIPVIELRYVSESAILR